MSDDPTTTTSGDDATRGDHQPPAGASFEGTWAGPDGTVSYLARGEWIVLREKDKPVAEMFSVSYVQRGDTPDHVGSDGRPVTFVFNGGPGASSAFLHVGALGPSRVEFNPDGTAAPPPARLVPNTESWLAFTDLVFIDPIGTGFSRLIPEPGPSKESGKAPADKPEDDKAAKRFFTFKRDLQSIGEFISRWLSTNQRWASPVMIAGESYGGYRVARLARMLPEDYGVGLNGAVIISPALEFSLLHYTDYDVLPWLDRVPTMAATAHAHGRGRVLDVSAPLDDVLAAAEEFAAGDYATFLVQGASMPAERRGQVLQHLADLIGLPVDDVTRAEGRIEFVRFCKELLADEGLSVGIYDGTVTGGNPFPNREGFGWPDPTLSGITRVFAAAVNQQIRGVIGVSTERDYHLMSPEVNTSWGDDGDKSWVGGPSGATDDLRYAMALSPHLKVLLSHGRFDLITPYFSSDRLADLMRLRDTEGERFTVQHYLGGHMFYTWEESRRAFRETMGDFCASLTAG